jgi:hypothetical protein
VLVDGVAHVLRDGRVAVVARKLRPTRVSSQ